MEGTEVQDTSLGGDDDGCSDVLVFLAAVFLTQLWVMVWIQLIGFIIRSV